MASNVGLLADILVGVYFGINMLHLPDPRRVQSLCNEYNITRMRLPDPNPDIIDAFRSYMKVDFTLDIPNMLLKNMNDNSKIESWFNKFVKPYINTITFEYIVVGTDGHNNILPTMKALRSLLNENNLTHVTVTTIINDTSLITKDPPSNGAFHPNIKNNLKDVLNFLAEQGSPESMVSLYPFKKYVNCWTWS